ncbi:MAG: hypothetical protein WBC95_09505 [Albidovulum sp.]
MRSLGNFVLICVQWLLVGFGLFTFLIACNTYFYEVNFYSSVPTASEIENSYRPPFLHRLLVGLTTGMISIGLGTALFYLRKIYLSREAAARE